MSWIEKKFGWVSGWVFKIFFGSDFESEKSLGPVQGITREKVGSVLGNP